MLTLGVVLVVLPFALGAAIAAGLFIGQTGRQGLFFGMIGSGTDASAAEEFQKNALDHQKRLGAVSAKAMRRLWPLALISLGVGLWLLLSR